MKGVRGWLALLCVGVLAMVAIGGITRLTGSGLSITEWRPVSGVLPPLTERAWADEHARYLQSPQGRLVNAGMSLGDFQRIFFWEYVHRVAGRVVGLALLLPLLVLAARRRLQRSTQRGLLLAAGVVLLQGAAGWFMVKSGLDRLPQVSHYRLALHLSLALVLLGILFWLWLQLGARRSAAPRPLTLALLGLLALQLPLGALVAGLHAGLWFSTFPTMNGEWIPQGLLAGTGSLLDSPVAVHFLHRALALLLLVLSLVLLWRARGARGAERHAAACLLGALLLQGTLGAATVIGHVPLVLAVLHQVGGCVVLLAALGLLHAQGERVEWAVSSADDAERAAERWRQAT